MDNFFLIAFAFGLGYVLQKLKLFPEDTPFIINKFVIYISLPALILVAIPRLSFAVETFVPPMIAWIVMVSSALLVLAVSRSLGFSKKIEGSLMLVAVLTNSSFVGIPMITAYLGEGALGYLMMYDQLGTALALGIYVPFVVAFYTHTGTIQLKAIAKKVLLFPPLIAMIMAFFMIGKSYPSMIEHTLEAFTATIIPLALVAAGLQLKLFLPKAELIPFTAALSIKLFFAPLVAWSVCYFLGWHSLSTEVAILEAGMAPMITAGAIASMSGLAPRLSSAIVGYGIIFSFFTSSVLFSIIHV